MKFLHKYLDNSNIPFDTLTLPIESSMKFKFQPPGRPIKTPVKVPRTYVRLVLTAVKSEQFRLEECVVQIVTEEICSSSSFYGNS